jgi:threonine dehydrogenase-like Zn-dependent dehydrogenase
MREPRPLRPAPLDLRAFAAAVTRLDAAGVEGSTTAHLSHQPGGWACTTVAHAFTAPLVPDEPLPLQVARLVAQLPPGCTTAHVTVVRRADHDPQVVEVRAFQSLASPTGAF